MRQPESEDALKFRLIRIIKVLNEIQPILIRFIKSKSGQESGGRERYVAYSIIERFYYNSMAAAPLAEELAVNHNIATPLSHIFRAVIYEILVGYWVFEEDFYNRIARLNRDYVNKNINRIKASMPNFSDADEQRIFYSWMHTAPENFELIEQPSGDGLLKLKSSVKSIQFSAIYDYLKGKIADASALAQRYELLSQQAHFSEFSREIIYNRYDGNIRIFDTSCKSMIEASISFINKIDSSSEVIQELQKLIHEHYTTPRE